MTISYSYQLQTFLCRHFCRSAFCYLLNACGGQNYIVWVSQCASRGVYLWRGIQRQSFMVSAAEITVLLRIKTLFSLQVWSLEQPDWHCKIDEGSIGLLSSRWSPDGRHILNTTEFHVSVKSVCAWLLAFMCSEVCLCTSLSGFNCCWPVKKGNLKIARHQSLPWPPLHPPPPPPTRYMYSAWFHRCLPISILPYKMLENLSNTVGPSGGPLIVGVCPHL